MKMKYFRFLYGETMSCFCHLGELKDTQTDEKFTFLYLRGTQGLVNQAKSEHMLFLCPDYVDMVVLGSVDESSLAMLKGLQKETKIGTLVIPGESEKLSEEQISSQMNGVEKMVCLKKSVSHKAVKSEENIGAEYSGQYAEMITGAEHSETWTADLNGVGDSYRISAAGWTFIVKCWTEGSLAMIHIPEKKEREGADAQEKVFDDCVMNVKTIEAGKRCSREKNPDEYGCAMGCVLHQDYDVCKWKEADRDMPYVAGTMLVSGIGSDEERKALEEEFGDALSGVRFFAIESSQENGWVNLIPRAEEEKIEPKRYFIGTTLSDREVAEVCRAGLNRIPVVLSEGSGICCSGFLKYADKEI